MVFDVVHSQIFRFKWSSLLSIYSCSRFAKHNKSISVNDFAFQGTNTLFHIALALLEDSKHDLLVC